MQRDEAVAEAGALEWAARLTEWALGVFVVVGSATAGLDQEMTEIQEHATRLDRMREAAWARAKAGGEAA